VTFTVAPLASNDVKPGQRARDVGHPGRSGNDVASTGRTLDPSSVDLDPTTPGQQTTLTVSGEGVWTVDSSGEVIFTPESGYFLDPTPITYTIADDQGNLSNVATITVDYVPVASDDVSTGNPIGQPVIIDVLANDTTGRHAGSGHGADRGDGQPRRRVGGSGRRHLDGQPDDRCDHLHAGSRLHGRPDADRVHGAGRRGQHVRPGRSRGDLHGGPAGQQRRQSLGNTPGTSVILVVPATTWPRPAAPRPEQCGPRSDDARPADDADRQRRRRVDGGQQRRSHLHAGERLLPGSDADHLHHRRRPGQPVQRGHDHGGLRAGGQRRRVDGQSDRSAGDHRRVGQRHHGGHAGSGHGADRGDGQPRRRVGGCGRRHLDGQPDDRCDHLHAGSRLHGQSGADRVHGAGRRGQHVRRRRKSW
jgi:hypothetical protein